MSSEKNSGWLSGKDVGDTSVIRDIVSRYSTDANHSLKAESSVEVLNAEKQILVSRRPENILHREEKPDNPSLREDESSLDDDLLLEDDFADFDQPLSAPEPQKNHMEFSSATKDGIRDEVRGDTGPYHISANRLPHENTGSPEGTKDSSAVDHSYSQDGQDSDKLDEQIVDPLADDEQWLQGDDVVLFEEDASGAFKQLEGSVFWRIEGMYDDKGKTFHRFRLRDKPPILIVESSDGLQYASFVLSRELTRSLSDNLNDLKKAYYGASRKRGEPRRVDDSVRKWVKENPIRLGISALLIVSLIVLAIVL